MSKYINDPRLYKRVMLSVGIIWALLTPISAIAGLGGLFITDTGLPQDILLAKIWISILGLISISGVFVPIYSLVLHSDGQYEKAFKLLTRAFIVGLVLAFIVLPIAFRLLASGIS